MTRPPKGCPGRSAPLGAAIARRKAPAAIAEEGQRVAREIATAGAEQWSADQRDILNIDGVRVRAD